MNKLFSAVSVAALAAFLTVTSALAQFRPPPPPPSAADTADHGGNRWKVTTKTVVQGGACIGGGGMIAFNPPVPLPKMSKRQQQRFETEMRRYNRAKFEWGIGCAGLGPVGGSAAIVADDIISRFVIGEIPPARTPRQEGLLFCRNGTVPCPDLTGPDPDLYGPK